MGFLVTAAEFAAALEVLGLKKTGHLTCRLLGMGPRQLQRICAGHAPVAGPAAVSVRVLLYLCRAHGLTPAALDRALAEAEKRYKAES